MRWPVYKAEAATEGPPVKTVSLMDHRVPLWKWGVARCAECGKQMKVKRNILDGKLRRLAGDEPCACFRMDGSGVQPTAVVTWEEEVA